MCKIRDFLELFFCVHPPWFKCKMNNDGPSNEVNNASK